MKLISEPVTLKELKKISQERFGNFVKAVVDIKNELLVIDADLHADQEKFLIEKGSKQANLWGINLYPDLEGEDFIEFDSMINLRPSQNNFTRGIEDTKLQEKIRQIVKALIIQK